MTATASITSLQQARESGLPASTSLAAVQRSAAVGFSDLQAFENLQRMAKPLAASALVPQQFRNNIGDCMIALDMAQRLHATRFKSCRTSTSCTGRPPGRKFLIATINACNATAACAMNGRASPAMTTTAAARGLRKGHRPAP